MRNESFIPQQSSDWIYFFLLALVPTLLGHSLFNWSLKWLSTSTISMAILFEPVGAIILAYYLLDEVMIWSQIIGGLIVIGGISLFVADERKSRVIKNNNLAVTGESK